MSDFVLNIISTDPAWVPSGDLAGRAVLVFQRLVPAATEVKAEFFGGIQFVDQGSNFESVSCPRCGELLDQAWWSERMDAAWSPDTSRFTDLQVLTPCCAARSSLNDLDYCWPAGFASFSLSAWNPGRVRSPAQSRRSAPAGDVYQVVRLAGRGEFSAPGACKMAALPGGDDRLAPAAQRRRRL